MLTKRSINSNQHPSRSESTFLESHRFFPIGRSLFDLLLSEFEKTGVPVDLVRLGIEPKSDIDFPAGLINPIFLGQYSCLYRVGFGQVRIERKCAFRRCQSAVATWPAPIRAQQNFSQRDQGPGVGIVR